MGTGMILGIVIVSPVVLSAAVLLRAPEEWLRTFAVWARSMGRLM
jgi:hypothetical protein